MKAGAYGATRVLDSSRDEVLPRTRECNKGYGVDIAFDCAGPPPALKLAIDAVRPNGTVNKVAWGPEPVEYSLDPIIEKAIRLQGSFSHTWEVWEACLALLATRQVDLEGLITHELPLAEWERAFRLVESRAALKVLLEP